MERNQIIGFILIFGTLLAWTMFNKPSSEELEKRQRTKDSIMLSTQTNSMDTSIETLDLAPQNVENTLTNDSLKLEKNKSVYGGFSVATVGVNTEVVLENDLMKITFQTKGGNITSVILKNHYKTVKGDNGKDGKELIEILNNPDNKFEYFIPLANQSKISTSNLYFTPTLNGNQLSMKASIEESSYFEQKYTLIPGTYNLDYTINSVGLTGFLDPSANTMTLNWLNHLSKYEKGEQFEQSYSTVYYKQVDKDRDYCNCVSDDTQELDGKGVEWVAHSNQFFNTSLITKSKPFGPAKMSTKMTDYKNSDVIKVIQSELSVPLGSSFDMTLYIGPNEFKNLASFDNKLEEIIPFGSSIFGTINRWLIRPFFDFLSQFISNKGIVILVLIFLIKMALYPLMYKMLYSQAKMGALKPELVHLKEKFKDDTQKQQLETMKIYREYGVSPLGGCMPMILQMPIWYALFRFFPASITFRQESFLWANDLSTYDVLFYLPFEIPFFGAHVSLFTLLWAVSTIVYTYYNMQNMDLSANPAMKYIQYLMPVMFLAFFNNYASGLTAYMFFSNLINILQTVITKNYIFDESKIRAQLLKEKEKPKKKGGFQAKLEEAMKQQQAIQEQKKKGGK